MRLPCAGIRLLIKVNLPQHVLRYAGKGMAAGWRKYLEFSAGAYHGVTAITWGRKNVQHLNQNVLLGNMINIVNLGAGGMHKRALQAFTPSRSHPLAGLLGIMVGQVYF
jgi:hypothetical protein